MQKSMRVLLASPAFDTPAGPLHIQRVWEVGCAVTRLAGDGLDTQNLERVLPGHKILVVGSEPVSCAAMCAAPELELIVRTGKGIDNIDATCPRLADIEIVPVTDANTRAVAEFAVFAMIAALRRLPEALADSQAGMWRKPIGRELSGKMVGIVGLGLIGEDVASLLAPFGCSLIAFDPHRPIDDWPSHITRATVLEELTKVADVVTLHAPGGAFQWDGDSPPPLKPGAVLVNTARGSLVQVEDAVAWVARGVLSGAAIDVFHFEPYPIQELDAPGNILLSPHIAAHTVEALDRAAAAATDVVVDWVQMVPR